MKLIIECAEQTYSECKKISGLSETAFVIANGKPYDPKGDCISREALKEQINATDFDFGDYYDNTEEIRKRVCEAIDNALTVEAYTSEDIVKYVSATEDLVREKLERPKGEWVNREAVSNTIFPFWERYECNQCHKFNGYSKFCPNCGAKMQGGAE